MAKKKLKTKKALLKRIKITKSGKIMRRKAGKSHLLSGKRANRKRKLRKATVLSSAYVKIARQALPYHI